MTKWTREELIKALERTYSAHSGPQYVLLDDKARAIAALLRADADEIANLRKLDAEAATYVETVIAMRTAFTGDEPYVGWKGLGLALNEALDERDRLRKKVRADAWVKIEDMPEEWRDGRPVELCDNRVNYALEVCEYDNTFGDAHPWRTLDGISYSNDAFTHARLVTLPESAE